MIVYLLTNVPFCLQVIWDEHIYTGPKDFISRFDQFDNWREHTNNQKSFASIMEYHVNMIDRVGDPTSQDFYCWRPEDAFCCCGGCGM